MKEITEFMIKNNILVMVWSWKDCPLEEKYSLGHGGMYYRAEELEGRKYILV